MQSAKRSARVALGGMLVLLLGACGGDNLFPPYGLTGMGVIPATGTIEGTVAGGQPLGGVSVILIGQDSTVTDGAGFYRFTDVPASTHSVTVRVPLNFTLAPGDSATRTVQLPAGGTATVNWNLVAEGAGP